MQKQRKIAVFDFDGTITTRDTMIDFIGFSCGKFKLILGFIIFAPMIAIMFLRIIDNHKCKERLLSWYFKNMRYDMFVDAGERYAKRISGFIRPETLSFLKERKEEGCTIYVISASILEWVKPICTRLGVDYVMATEMEVGNDGRLTGRFLNHNCYGEEKVKRLRDKEPNRDEYFLYAYGDSKGDYNIFSYADEYVNISKL